MEKVVNSFFPADFAEFWRAGRLDGILAMLRLMAAPAEGAFGKPLLIEPPGCDRRPQYRCVRCPRAVATYSHLKQHMMDKHIKQEIRTKCPKCKKEIKQQRNLKAHMASKACREA